MSVQPTNVQPIINHLDYRKLINSIEQSMNIEKLQNALMSYPEQIRHKQQQLQSARESLEASKAELLFEEQMILVEITEAQNPSTGKPMYSNDTARKAELAKRLRESAPYHSKLKDHRILESAVTAGQFDLDLLNNQFAAASSVVRLTTGRLELMASLGA